MIKKTALEKRVKRRITARSHRFFAVCPPYLKHICYNEIIDLSLNIAVAITTNESGQLKDRDDSFKLKETALFQDVSMVSGGIEFTSTTQGCYAANLYLRTPSRILMRIGNFKAENFRTLEKKMSEIEWELYFNPSCPIKFEVSTKSSRLYHTDAVAQRCNKIVSERSAICYNHEIEQSEAHKINQTIMVRAVDDNFEISIDSSGELLHKRGLKDNVGVAPLRETLAFATLSLMKYPQKLSDSYNLLNRLTLTPATENLQPDIPLLIDGMCGSGTFALEAAMIAHNIPAGFFRNFAFEGWLCFSKKQWEYMKRIAENEIRDSFCKHPFIFALDQDTKILDGLQKRVDKFNLSTSIKVVKRDFFDILPKELTSYSNKGFVVLNPPYGKRIGDKENRDKIFYDIGKKLKADFKGWSAAVIIPDKRLLKYFYGIKSVIPMFHGGLEIDAAIIDC